MTTPRNPTSNDTTFAGLAVRLLHWADRWRIELAVAAGVAMARNEIAVSVGQGPAALCLTAVVAVILSVRPLRRRGIAHVNRQARRRQWETIFAWLFPAPGTPLVRRHGASPVGVWAQVRMGPGGTVRELATKTEAIAAWLSAVEVRVTPDPASAAFATVHAMRTDPLSRPTPPWPGIAVERTDLWRPVPVGIDENGRQVTVGLFEHNLLLGGEPGAGKSVALSQLVAAAALDQNTTLWLLDGKLVELACWRPCAAGTAGIPIGDGIELLRHVQQVMDDRYQTLLDQGLRKIAPGTGLHVVVVDELAHYLTWPDKKARDAFTDLLRDLVAQGRAAGIIVLAATQKPSADVIPTSLRDLFGYRWALRCTTPAASDTILGGGWASNGVTASTVAPAARGVGWLLHESGTPIRLRAHHLDDHTLNRLAQRAAQLRHGGRP